MEKLGDSGRHGQFDLGAAICKLNTFNQRRCHVSSRKPTTDQYCTSRELQARLLAGPESPEVVLDRECYDTTRSCVFGSVGTLERELARRSKTDSKFDSWLRWHEQGHWWSTRELCLLLRSHASLKAIPDPTPHQ